MEKSQVEQAGIQREMPDFLHVATGAVLFEGIYHLSAYDKHDVPLAAALRADPPTLKEANR